MAEENPNNETAGATGSTLLGGTPAARLNLAENPELDRNLEEVGKTVEAASGGSGTDPETSVQQIPYDQDVAKDATRQTITLWLIGLLCVIVGLTFVALFARGMSSGFRDAGFFGELKQVLDVLVGPIITLLASAVGFYFGYKQGSLSEQVKKLP